VLALTLSKSLGQQDTWASIWDMSLPSTTILPLPTRNWKNERNFTSPINTNTHMTSASQSGMSGSSLFSRLSVTISSSQTTISNLSTTAFAPGSLRATGLSHFTPVDPRIFTALLPRPETCARIISRVLPLYGRERRPVASPLNGLSESVPSFI